MNKKFTTSVLAVGLIVTTSGWALANEKSNQQLKEKVEEQKEDLSQKSTKIANLENVIDKKNKQLKKDETVIDKQKEQIKAKDEKLKDKNEELKKLKNDINKKKNKNFKNEKKGSDVGGTSIGTFEMTSYIAMCQEGCTGITRSGVDIKNRLTYQGHRIIATDPNVIPLWSIVKIHTKSGSFTAISLDTGGGINGKEIDFLVSSESEAVQNGRQMVEVEIIRKGK